MVFCTHALLGAGDTCGCRSFFTIDDFEGDDIANLEFIESYADELLGVEEKILHFAFARDESESSVRERLDSSGHSFLLAT